MSKDKLDLDFGDISGGISTPTPASAPTQEKQPGKVEPLGYEVALRADEPGKFIFKDLADLTGEEFISWMEWVYPFNAKDTDPKHFNSRINKVRAFENILRFHQSSIFYAKKEEKVLVH